MYYEMVLENVSCSSCFHWSLRHVWSLLLDRWGTI